MLRTEVVVVDSSLTVKEEISAISTSEDLRVFDSEFRQVFLVNYSSVNLVGFVYVASLNKGSGFDNSSLGH